MVHFRPESVVHFAPELLVHFAPESVVHFSPDYTAYSDLSILKRFKSPLTFSDINYALMRELASWLEKTVSETTGKKYRAYYIAQILAAVRQKYNKAVREGLAKPVDLNYKYKSYYDEIINIYLTEAELDKIKNTKFIGGPAKQREVVRDWFLIGCYTGLRVGNYLNLKNCTINREQNYLEAVVNKNGPIVRIPLHKTVLEILDRWGDDIPQPPLVGGFNRTIRTVVKMAGITDKIFVVRRIGGERIVEQVEKYKLVSSHTARRSLATNLYLRNVPIRFIMSLTGHKTEAMCLRYIKAGINDMYEKVAALDFWK